MSNSVHAQRAKSIPGYVPSLDGLRGIAILGVLLFHLGNKLPALHIDFATQYGWAGVDLFFVISGFLITGILLDSAGSEHYFRNFYVRRILRVWPLYFALLAFVFLLLPWFVPALRERIFTQCHPWQSYLLFVQNFFVHDFGIGPVGVTWSLAIEEQFYLVWPLIILLLPRRLLPTFLICVVLLSPVGRALAQLRGASPTTLYTHTLFRLDSISAGALLAVWVRTSRFSKTSAARILIAFACVGLVGCAITLRWLSARAVCANLRFSALALLCSGIVGSALLANPGTILYKSLTTSWLRYVGKISFGLYLLHVTIFDILTPQRLSFLGNGWAGNLAVLLIDFAAALLLATCSWRFFESPILALKYKFKYGRSSGLLGRSGETNNLRPPDQERRAEVASNP
jgi:peptidoglycan/LPS O-acetylase OafA/YrhL